MNFKEYVNEIESSHAENPKKIADEFKQHFNLMESEDDVLTITRLIVHVCGEHLGDWRKGIELLRKLKNNATIKDQRSMKRNVAILELGNNPNSSIDNFSPSDQAWIYAITASALARLGGAKNAKKFLEKSIEIVSTQLAKDDPACEELALSVGRIARSIEKKVDRNANEIELMNLADMIGRKLD